MPDSPAAAGDPATPDPDLGSPALAAALAARDTAAIGQALRHGHVIVPITRGPDGETQTAVFGAGDGTYDLCVFSSARSFAAYQAPTQEFALQRGSSLIVVIEQHGALLRRVLFDPADPHAMQASPPDVLATLRPQVTDDDVAWVTDGPGPASPTAQEQMLGLGLALTPDWTPLDLTEPKAVQKQVKKFLKHTLRAVPTRPGMREELSAWLLASAQAAIDAGDRQLDVILRPSTHGLVAIAITVHRHVLGPEIGGRSHLDAITERIRSDLRPDDELIPFSAPAGPTVRHTHIQQAAGERHSTPVLVTDYWLEHPDRRELFQLRFTSPLPHQRAVNHQVTDDIVRATVFA